MSNIRISQILLKRGNSTASSGYVGPLGEITIDTTLKTLRIHDGVHPGGNIVGGSGNVVSFNQSLNTTDAVSFDSVGATVGFIAQINGTNPGQELVIQAGGSYNWTFHGNGGLEFPDNSVQNTAYRYTVSTNAPTMTTGALWFNSTDGRLYVNYNNTWVDASPTEIDPSAIRFNEQDQIEFPDGTLQSTAWLDGGSSIVNTTIMSINDFAGGNYDNQGSVSVTYTPYTGAESGFSFNAEFQSPLDATKGVTVGAISTPLIHNNNSINIEINLEDSTKRIWSFEEDGDFKIPGGLTLPGAILSTGHLELDANYDGGNSVYIGNNHPTAGMLGGVVIGDSRGGFVNIITTKLIIGETSVPTHSYGAPGDIAGEVAFDNDYIYYCKQNYVNNSTDIWVRVVWTDTNW